MFTTSTLVAFSARVFWRFATSAGVSNTVVKVQKRPLPCHPCAHRAPCCRNGTTLTLTEAERISARFGVDKVQKLGTPELRSRFQTPYPPGSEHWVTVLQGDRCVFWDQGCKIHESDAFPQSCRLYPWQVNEGSQQMPNDAYLCPELGLPQPPLQE